MPAALPRPNPTLAVILLFAAALRFWQLGDVPPGPQMDEAYNAIDAARVADGARDPFFTANGGREPLSIYLQAVALAALGRDDTNVALRLVSALAGLATIAAVYGCVSDVFRDKRLGLLAAAFLAVSYWHLHFSRYAIRAILAPLWTTGAVWAWWRASGRPGDPAPIAGMADAGVIESAAPRRRGSDHQALGRLGWAVACGACLAAAVYSHPTGRLVPLVLIGHAAYRVARDRGAWRSSAGALAAAGLTAAVLFLPLGWWFLWHPGWFTAHPGDVSLVALAERDFDGSVIRALAGNAAAVLGMFFFMPGDPSTFHNLTFKSGPDAPTVGLPLFDPLSALLALLGIGIALAALAGRDADRRDRAVLAATWAGVMLMPTLLSDRPPNYSRAIAALPVIVLLPALGLRWGVAALDVRWSRGRPGDGGGAAPGLSAVARSAITAGALAVAGAWTAWHYFVVFAHRTPHVYDSYDVKLQDAYRALVGQARDADVFLHPLWAEHATVAYLNAAGPVRALDATETLVLPEGARDVVVAFPAKEAQREGWAEGFASLFGGAAARRDVADAQGRPLLVTFRVAGGARGDLEPPTDAPLEPRIWTAARFGGRIDLLGYTVGAARPGAALPITLVWRCLEPVGEDLTTFVHLVGPGGEALGQSDREPGRASYRTSAWQAGDVVIDHFAPELAEGARGPVTVEVGWYNARTSARLTVGDGTALKLRPVEVDREAR